LLEEKTDKYCTMTLGFRQGKCLREDDIQVLVKQRPGTAKGVCFITIEDETGVANLVVFENHIDEFRKEILQLRF
jgi:DNA polymerase III alpha subunit